MSSSSSGAKEEELNFFDMEKDQKQSNNNNPTTLASSSKSQFQKLFERRMFFHHNQSNINPLLQNNIISSGTTTSGHYTTPKPLFNVNSDLFLRSPAAAVSGTSTPHPPAVTPSSPLTIFYNGTVSVFDVPHDMVCFSNFNMFSGFKPFIINIYIYVEINFFFF
ncbi:hypothetical protein AQUCO_02100005v1 [Aquilegia coerulea]|uniref:Tify domain-containing protein n=2 Tax=Aquilegia coerulea TaxID=218851 RepID=A0A2G5DEC5_AQUCA|nr:hypothetical protein AQUCO_02100005v1 [Aquilegia coerulea]